MREPSENGTGYGDRDWVLIGQGAYFIATGLWPLMDMGSFEKVTGPKADRWLVKTVGVLVTVIGTALLEAGRRGTPTKEIRMLAAGSAAGLAGVDVLYSAKGRISPIYLLDAALETALLGLMAYRALAPRQPGP